MKKFAMYLSCLLIFMTLILTSVLVGSFNNLKNFSSLGATVFATEDISSGIANGERTANLDSKNVSVFIRKPTYSVVLEDKLYFIDEADNLLKAYDLTNLEFVENYVDLTNYSVISTCVSENYWYLLVFDLANEKSKVLKVNLQTLEVDESFSCEVDNYFKAIFVQNVTLKVKINQSGTDDVSNYTDKSFTLVTCSVKGYNTKLYLFDNTANPSENQPEIIEIKLEDTSVIENLRKTISYQVDGRLYIVYVYNNSLGYFSVAKFDELTTLNQESKVVDNLNTPKLKEDESTKNVNLSLIDIEFAKINSNDFLAVSYRNIDNNNEFVKLYSFDFSNISDTTAPLIDFNFSNIKYLSFNGDTFTYPDSSKQIINYVKVSATETPNPEGGSSIIEFSHTMAHIENPLYNITYYKDEVSSSDPTQKPFIYKTTESLTSLYSDPWGAKSKIDILKGKDVIVIGEARVANSSQTKIEDYDYCLYTYCEKNYCGFIKNSDLIKKNEITPTEAGYKNRLGVWPKTILYSLPTTILKPFETKESCPLTPSKIMVIEDNSTIEVRKMICGYEANGVKFVKVIVNENQVGYIDEKCIRKPAEIVDFVITNATIKKDNTIVYLSASKDATKLPFTLKEGTNVRINGARNTKSGFTNITFNDEFGVEYSGYIETDYLKADAWSTLQIVGCILIAINIGLLILILVFRNQHLGSQGQKLE